MYGLQLDETAMSNFTLPVSDAPDDEVMRRKQVLETTLCMFTFAWVLGLVSFGPLVLCIRQGAASPVWVDESAGVRVELVPFTQRDALRGVGFCVVPSFAAVIFAGGIFHSESHPTIAKALLALAAVSVGNLLLLCMNQARSKRRFMSRVKRAIRPTRT